MERQNAEQHTQPEDDPISERQLEVSDSKENRAPTQIQRQLREPEDERSDGGSFASAAVPPNQIGGVSSPREQKRPQWPIRDPSRPPRNRQTMVPLRRNLRRIDEVVDYEAANVWQHAGKNDLEGLGFAYGSEYPGAASHIHDAACNVMTLFLPRTLLSLQLPLLLFLLSLLLSLSSYLTSLF